MIERILCERLRDRDHSVASSPALVLMDFRSKANLRRHYTRSAPALGRTYRSSDFLWNFCEFDSEGCAYCNAIFKFHLMSPGVLTFKTNETSC